MLLDILGVHQDIVQKDKDESIQVLTQEIIHHPHELCGGISNTKRHYQILVQTPPRFECCFVNVPWAHWHLPIARS